MRTAGKLFKSKSKERGKMSGSRVIFYYDVVCPFAYMASRLVEAMAQRTGADIVWRPVLLGELPHSSTLSLAISPFSYPPLDLQAVYTT